MNFSRLTAIALAAMLLVFGLYLQLPRQPQQSPGAQVAGTEPMAIPSDTEQSTMPEAVYQRDLADSDSVQVFIAVEDEHGNLRLTVDRPAGPPQ